MTIDIQVAAAFNGVKRFEQVDGLEIAEVLPHAARFDSALASHGQSRRNSTSTGMPSGRRRPSNSRSTFAMKLRRPRSRSVRAK